METKESMMAEEKEETINVLEFNKYDVAAGNHSAASNLNNDSCSSISRTRIIMCMSAYFLAQTFGTRIPDAIRVKNEDKNLAITKYEFFTD